MRCLMMIFSGSGDMQSGSGVAPIGYWLMAANACCLLSGIKHDG